MSRVEAFTIDATAYQGDPRVRALLVAIAEAWGWAEQTNIISENESRRWSPVCDAAEIVLGSADEAVT